MAEKVLRVGVSENLPWTEVSDDGSVFGPEADILTAYAETLGASVDWTPGAESQLILLLEQGDLDVVIGGLRSDSPWAAKAALTRPHAKTVGPDVKEEKLVFACRLGENAMLSNVERFLIRPTPAAMTAVGFRDEDDGVTNLRGAVRDLLDSRPTTVDGSAPHPLIATMASTALRESWVAEAAVRVRDMGHVFHSEVFVVPLERHDPTLEQIDALTAECQRLDWKVRDTVVAPVRHLPDGLQDASTRHSSMSGTNT